VFDGRVQLTGSASSEWKYLSEEDGPTFARAFDPQAVWQSFCELVTTALKDAGTMLKDVSAVSVTSQRQAVVFLDRDNQEVYAGPNTDLRAVFEGGAIDDEMGDRVYQTTGHFPSLLFAPAKLRWFQHHRPDAYGRIATVLGLANWLAWRLTGVLASEPNLAGEAGLLDIHRRAWCTPLLDEIEVVSEAPSMSGADNVVGTVTGPAARDTGLPEGTPVVTAGADTQCGLLGLGVTSENQVGIVAGWSGALQMVTQQPIFSPERKTWAGCFLTPDRWVLESSPGDFGNSYRWLAETLFGGTEGAFERMDRLASATPVGSEGAIAVLGPTRMDMSRLGMRTGGFLFPVPITFSGLSSGHIVRATLEAMAYTVRANLEQIEEMAGTQAVNVMVGGGMTLASTWTRILTDVVCREIFMSAVPQVSGLGAFLCARTAQGDYGSLNEAGQDVATRLQRLEPNPLDSAEYEERYQHWLKASTDLDSVEM
jgi:autoinducer 2 (AI-2) kinase